MTNPKTPGDRFFENYCDLNGYLHWYESGAELLGLDAPTAPDYLVDRGGDRAVVEVKHFRTMRQLEQLMAMPGRAMFMESTVGKLQSAARAGGHQLLPCAASNLPLVVVLTTPLPTDVDLDPDDVVAALLGKTEHVFNLEQPGLEQTTYSGEGAAVLHRNSAGVTVNRLPHVSAVMTLYGLELFPRVDVYDLSAAPGFAGTPLPRSMFDAEDDRWFGFVESDRFTRLPPPFTVKSV